MRGTLRHGHARRGQHTRTYKAWASMIVRCFYIHGPRYARYGGRGITVCEHWQIFDNFLADMGVKPNGLTLERIDNDGNYEPSNCRWATFSEQYRNRSTNVHITIGGRTKILQDWLNQYGLTKSRVWRRVNELGWSIEEAITRPLKGA